MSNQLNCTRRRFLQGAALAAALPASIPAGAAGGFENEAPGGESVYFGDLHTHTWVSDGNGRPEENFQIAKSHLDFWTMCDHAYDPVVFSLDYTKHGGEERRINNQWGSIREMCRSYEAPGRFVPFMGYEWTNFHYGHHNVYYLDYDQPIRMPATLPELYSAMKGVDALVIPHHPGYPVGVCGKDWNYHDEKLSPFVEIYSTHGSSEIPEGLQVGLTTGSWMGPGASAGCVQAGLARGYKLGIMASSDSHADHPGAYDVGLMAVHAKELTRKSLWESFQRRRVYAVTGDRILLDLAVNGSPMGGTHRGMGKRTIRVSTVGWDKIERVEIIKNNALFHTFGEPSGPAPVAGKRRFRFRVEWGWDARAEHSWEASLALAGGKIVQALPCYRGPVKDRLGTGIVNRTDSRCSWNSKTEKANYMGQCRRYGDMIAFEVECPENDRIELRVTCDEMKLSRQFSPRDILRESTVHFMELDKVPVTMDGNYWSKMKVCSKFKVHQGWPTEQLTLDLTCEDDAAKTAGKQADFYYARVTQRNEQRAWSSPVWVENG